MSFAACALGVGLSQTVEPVIGLQILLCSRQHNICGSDVLLQPEISTRHAGSWSCSMALPLCCCYIAVMQPVLAH